MKRTWILVAAICAVAAFAPAAVAQDSVLWFDVRDNVTPEIFFFQAGQLISAGAGAPTAPFINGQDAGNPVQNAGREGQGQVVRLSPVTTTNLHDLNSTGGAANFYPNFDGDNDSSTARLWLYANVNGKCGSATDMLASVGVDMNTVDAVGSLGGRNRIGGLDYNWRPEYFAEANAGTEKGASDAADPPSWLGAKAVKVPVETGPTYMTTNGLVPQAEPYRIGSLDIAAGTRECTFDVSHSANSTFEIRMSINNLLVARVCNAETAGDEMVSLGYDGAAPEAAVNGSTMATSTEADTLVQIRLKGDSSGDGYVLINDVNDWLTALGQAFSTHTQLQCYLFDYTNDGQVAINDVNDNLRMLANADFGSPCP